MTLDEALVEKKKREKYYESKNMCVSIGFYSPKKPGWGLWINDYIIKNSSWERRGTSIMACSPEIASKLDLVAKPTAEELVWDDFDLFELDWTNF